jgi:hypothetical protein
MDLFEKKERKPVENIKEGETYLYESATTKGYTRPIVVKKVNQFTVVGLVNGQLSTINKKRIFDGVSS